MDKLGESEDVDVLVFDTSKFGLNVVQKPHGIFYLNKEKDSEGNTVKDDNGNTVYNSVPMFKGVFTQPKLYIDTLGLKSKSYKVTYNDYLSNLQVPFEGTLMDISKDLVSEVFYVQKRDDISKFIPSFIEASISKEQLEIKNYYSINGYFLHDGTIINNNLFLKDMYWDMSSEELSCLVQEQVSKYTNYLSHLGTMFTQIAKLILLMPFYYLFKQIKWQAPIKYILEYGKAQAQKSSASNTLVMGWYGSFDVDDDDLPWDSGAGTFASLRNEFNNFCTLPMLVDEAKVLMGKEDVQELLKDLGYNINGRGTANLDKQGENLKFKGFHHYVFTTNQGSNVFEGLSRRLIAYNFEESIGNDDFDYSNLDFSALYWVFSCAVCEYLNKEGVAVVKQYTPNEFIDLMLMKIEDTFNVDLSILQGVNPYEDRDTSLDYNTAEVLADNLQLDYNSYCKGTGNKCTSISGLISTNPSYKDWNCNDGIDNVWFWINERKLKRFLLNKSQKNTVTLEELLSFRGYDVEILDINSISELNMDNESDPLVYHYTGGNTRFMWKNLNTNSFILNARAMDVLFNQ